MTTKKMHIGMSIRGLGYHPAAWRHPDVPADGTLRFEHYARSAQAAERGKCDLIFFADGIGIRERDIPRGSLARSGYEIVEMEPMTLLPALAVVTKHIGLVTTASTTYNEPYQHRPQIRDARPDKQRPRRLERRHLLVRGRGQELQSRAARRLRHALCARCRVRGRREGPVGQLGGGRIPIRQASGQFFDESKMHVLDHKGRFFSVRGPLNVGRLPQGHPIVVQAGASEQGRELAAATADIVYAVHSDAGRWPRRTTPTSRRDWRSMGASTDDLKILPALRPVVGRTRRRKHAPSSTSCRSCSIPWSDWRASIKPSEICPAIPSTDRFRSTSLDRGAAQHQRAAPRPRAAEKPDHPRSSTRRSPAWAASA